MAKYHSLLYPHGCRSRGTEGQMYMILNSRILRTPCKEIRSDHENLLYHTGVWRLSNSEVLKTDIELKDELHISFFNKNKFALLLQIFYVIYMAVNSYNYMYVVYTYIHIVIVIALRERYFLKNNWKHSCFSKRIS